MRFYWLLSFLLFLLPQVSFAEQKPFAVLEFVGVGFNDSRLLGLLSDGVRGGLIKQIDKKEYLVMTRESILQILKDNGKDASCMVGECEVEIGRNIGAEYVISGSVTYYANTYIVTVKLHNTTSSELLATDQVKNTDPLALLEEMPFLGERLMIEGKLISDKTMNTKGLSDRRSSKQEAEKDEQEEISGDGYHAVLIPFGSFQMGCVGLFGLGCEYGESPAIKVTLTQSFYMMKTEVTQDFYASVMGNRPSRHTRCSDCPVEQVSWFEAIAFVNQLSVLEGKEQCYAIDGENVTWKEDCSGWRLPTEAEWEYAARGGEPYKYAGSNNINRIGWHGKNSDGMTHPVGQKQVNGYGLFDMSGNVNEWCWDEYGYDYSDAPLISRNPKGPRSKLGTIVSRVQRGGSYKDRERLLMVFSRGWQDSLGGNPYVGIRPVRTR